MLGVFPMMLSRRNSANHNSIERRFELAGIVRDSIYI
jgi:hypothetical protein